MASRRTRVRGFRGSGLGLCSQRVCCLGPSAAAVLVPQQTARLPFPTADAQRGFVEAATALLPDRKQSCKRLQAAAANATYAHEMPGYCALTGTCTGGIGSNDGGLPLSHGSGSMGAL